jgi:hypothetical protein
MTTHERPVEPEDRARQLHDPTSNDCLAHDLVLSTLQYANLGVTGLLGSGKKPKATANTSIELSSTA